MFPGRGALVLDMKPYPERRPPAKLVENGGCSFQGSMVAGMGFTLTPDERDALVKQNPRNAQRIFPYLGGQEVNTSPTQDFDRYAISFGAMSLEEAVAWPDLLAVVREKVKPERDKLRNNADGRRYKAMWWRFGRWSPALYAALAPLSRCLVTACHAKHLMFAFQPTDRIFSHGLYAFPLGHYAAFAVLQSRVHEPWARLLSSSLEDRLRYAASDCFDTFPFPTPDPRAKHPALEKAGEKLYDARAKFMVEADQGLTKTYNALKDPNCSDRTVLKLRGLHEAMDRAVLDAYGWGDIDVLQYPEPLGLEVIDRLYALNQDRR
jgi:hypothetical protein